MKDDIIKTMEILTAYTEYLHANGYVDADIYAEGNTVEAFVKENYLHHPSQRLTAEDIIDKYFPEQDMFTDLLQDDINAFAQQEVALAVAEKDKEIAELKWVEKINYDLMVSGEKRGVDKANQEWKDRIQKRIDELRKQYVVNGYIPNRIWERITELENLLKQVEAVKEKSVWTVINAELERAKAKHPDFPSDMFRQLAIMQEEAGEVTKAVLHFHYEGGTLNYIREELIQTAAMCLRMLENLPESPKED